MQTTLIEGDALKPESSDMLCRRVYLPLHKSPRGDGWRIMSGGPVGNLWARVAYRYECERDTVKGRAAAIR